jgi:predicted ribosome quality control (RQC) complex YloA/Tae2 family protein
MPVATSLRAATNIDIGNPGVATESSTVRIGTAGTQTKTFIAGIRGVTTANANAIPVLIDSAGQFGTISSSREFKSEIKPIGKASEAILALKPVTFHYKSDKTGTPQFGLIAEEVAEVSPDLIVRDEKGEIYTVRYDAVNAMLLNEFLKEHHKVEELESAVAQLTARLKEQDSKIQRVSDQLEIDKRAREAVAKQ